MIPYADLPWFLTLLAVAVPAVLLQLAGRPVRLYATFAALLMTVAIFSDSVGVGWTLIEVAAFIAWESALILGYALLRRRWNPSAVFHAVVLAALAPLIAVKVSPLLGIASPIGTTLIGFLGISYVTFRCLEIVIETRDGLITHVGFLDLLSFLLFFPTIASGPIDRFRRFVAERGVVRSRQEYVDLLRQGLPRIFLGVFYKFVVAGIIQLKWLGPATARHGLIGSDVSYMYAYGLYLFFDFAGYSALAVGTAHLFGVKVMDNFNKPFLAQNIREFWQRWHISLSTWFRDFVFMRFAMLNARRKWLKDRRTSASAGYVLSMGLMGVWHGLSANYILYGLYHGLLLAGYEWFAAANKKHGWMPDTRATRWASIAVTFQAVFFGFLIFSGRIV